MLTKENIFIYPYHRKQEKKNYVYKRERVYVTLARNTFIQEWTRLHVLPYHLKQDLCATRWSHKHIEHWLPMNKSMNILLINDNDVLWNIVIVNIVGHYKDLWSIHVSVSQKAWMLRLLWPLEYHLYILTIFQNEVLYITWIYV